ncbi:MAG: hypothetical protein O3C28_11695 [Proteobacteria bacterium]|nr:hypothetical protein [Pseudomonadota bacterium]
MSGVAEVKLPAGFERLERFVDHWALASEAARNQQRLRTAMADIQTFYAGVLGEMDALVEHLSRFRVSELPEPERRLMYLALSLMEVAPAVEIYHQPDIPDAIDASRLIIRSPL